MYKVHLFMVLYCFVCMQKSLQSDDRICFMSPEEICIEAKQEICLLKSEAISAAHGAGFCMLKGILEQVYGISFWIFVWIWNCHMIRLFRIDKVINNFQIFHTYFYSRDPRMLFIRKSPQCQTYLWYITEHMDILTHPTNMKDGVFCVRGWKRSI